MGKKTNWTSAEDQTLCRVWLKASDLQQQGGDQKAANFWTVVFDLFQQEVDSPVERPLTGLKVRWTRINRESQKFAGIFNEVQSNRMRQTEESGDDADESTAVNLLREHQWIDEAKSLFHQFYHVKFAFEPCWKQLRYSAKWIQLLANSNSNNNPTMLTMNALVTPTEAVEEVAQAPSTTSSEHDMVTRDDSATIINPAATAEVSSSPPPETTTTASVAAAAAVAAVAQESTDENVFFIRRRKLHADNSSEPFDHTPHQTQEQLPGLTSTLVEELKRQNELLEDQNAIALLKMDGSEMDNEARHCYELLRARYLKRARTSHGYSSSNARASTLV